MPTCFGDCPKWSSYPILQIDHHSSRVHKTARLKQIDLLFWREHVLTKRTKNCCMFDIFHKPKSLPALCRALPDPANPSFALLLELGWAENFQLFRKSKSWSDSTTLADHPNLDLNHTSIYIIPQVRSHFKLLKCVERVP